MKNRPHLFRTLFTELLRLRDMFAGPNKPGAAPQRRLLGLDCLEDRTTPAVFIVNFGATPFADSTDSATHGGSGTAGDPFRMSSLRGAILATNANGEGADTIVLPAGTYQLSLVGNDATGMAGDLDINGSLTLDGAGVGTTIIQGATAFNPATNVYTNSIGDKVIGINQDGTHRGLTVAIQEVTVRWGENTIASGTADFSYTGGGVDVFLTGTGNAISFTDVTITQNTNANSYGGGVNVDSGASGLPGDTTTNVYRGTVNFLRTTISDNRTTDTATLSSGGGVNLFADKHDVTFTDSTITQNVTTGATANGGGVNIRHTNGGTVTFTNTNITNNTSGGFGGGVLSAFVQNIQFTGGSISSNTSLGIGQSASGGGFLSGSNMGTTTQLSGVTITNNIATAGANGIGGGISESSAGTTTLTNVTLSGNSADTGGGLHLNPNGTFTMNGGSITGNTASLDGGGIATFTAMNTMAFDGVSITSNSAARNGGGVYQTGGSMDFQRGTVTGNTSNSDNTGGGDGAAFYRSTGGSLTVNFSRITGNTANTGGGGGTTGIVNTTTGVNAENNWWGGDAAPGTGGTAANSGTVDASPRLDLNISGTPTTLLRATGTSALTASFLTNSDGTPVTLANLTALIGQPITFGGTNGTTGGAQATVQSNGQATATFTAGSTLGAASASATVDSTPAATTNFTVAEITASNVDTLFTDVDGDGLFDPGDTVRYTITLTNPTGNTATGVGFTDTPGANTSLVVGSVTTTSGTITSGNTGGNTSVGISGATIAPGGSQTITFNAVIDPGLTTRSVSNQGTAQRAGFDILSDDPALGGTSDPTATTVDMPDVKVELLGGTTFDEDGAGTLTYTFTREGPTSTARTINFSVGSTAALTGDFTLSGSGLTYTAGASMGTLTFAAGSATATVTLGATDDAVVEANETVTLTVTPEGGSAIGYDVGTPSVATGTIANDDTATVTLSAVPAQDEGLSGTTDYVFTATLDNAVEGGFKLAYTTNNGTATAGSDYTDNDGTLIFAGTAGEPQTITVQVSGDNLVELTEDFTVALGALSNSSAVQLAAISTGGSPQTGTITNDDSATVSIAGNVSQSEGTTPQAFTVNLSNPVDVNVTVRFDTSDGSATIAGSDYTGITNQTVTFLAGTTTAQVVNVTVANDAIVENDEVFNVSIGTLVAGTPGRNVSLGTSTGTGTITNNDTATVTLSGGIAQNEGNSGITNYVFTATLNNAVQGGFDIAYSTNDVTANAGTDYVDNDGSLHFNGTVGENWLIREVRTFPH